MASPELKRVLERYRKLNEQASQAKSPEEVRAALDGAFGEFPSSDQVKCEPVTAGGVKAEWIASPDAAAERAILYLHGGGYAAGSIRTHRELAARLSQASAARCLVIDYRLAPEHPFPAAVEDAVAAYQWMLAQRVDPGKIAIAGDSAGGGLTIATMVALRDANAPLPAAGICISPWVDLEAAGETMVSKASEDPVVSREILLMFTNMYIGDRDPRMPLAAPLHADLHGLP
ncbi:MAG: alpha/beta hydrolase, partial [Candidatus Binataceae bacterium]